jgi:hypothetical protein
MAFLRKKKKKSKQLQIIVTILILSFIYPLEPIHTNPILLEYSKRIYSSSYPPPKRIKDHMKRRLIKCIYTTQKDAQHKMQGQRNSFGFQ